jgi:hypothetical protein
VGLEVVRNTQPPRGAHQLAQHLAHAYPVLVPPLLLPYPSGLCMTLFVVRVCVCVCGGVCVRVRCVCACVCGV